MVFHSSLDNLFISDRDFFLAYFPPLLPAPPERDSIKCYPTIPSSSTVCLRSGLVLPFPLLLFVFFSSSDLLS
jgi:hypothetical protein